MEPLSFIKNRDLKLKIIDAVRYTFLILDKLKDDLTSDMFKEETYRVVILYLMSCVEASLLYFYGNKKKIKKVEYKFIARLPSEFAHKNRPNDKIIVASETETEIPDYQLGLHELTNHFCDQSWISKRMCKKILALNDLRNTHHLSKARTKKCTLKDVEKAYDVLKHILTTRKIPRRPK